MVALTRPANETVLGKSSPDARNVREMPVVGVPPPLAEFHFTVQPSALGRESSSDSRSIPSGLAASYWKLPVKPATGQMFHASSQAAGSFPQPTLMRILYKVSLIWTHFTAILCPPVGAGCAAVLAPQAARNRRAKDGDLWWGGLALIWDSGGCVARLARHLGLRGGPQDAAPRA